MAFSVVPLLICYTVQELYLVLQSVVVGQAKITTELLVDACFEERKCIVCTVHTYLLF